MGFLSKEQGYAQKGLSQDMRDERSENSQER